VDPLLVEDVILHEQQNPQEQPMYTIEVFSDGSGNPEDVMKDILADTGMTPSIHGRGGEGNIPAAPPQVELRKSAENAIMAICRV
jgi:hypothetical protein